MSVTVIEGQATRSKQLARQMKKWREALDRTSIPGLVGYKKHVTQEEAAVLRGRAVSHYGNLERGRIDCQYSDEVLDTIALVLQLGEVSRRVLYLLATGREPKPGPYAAPRVNVAVQAKPACQPWPVYVLDPLWNVVEYNDATLRWFPHVVSEPNVMRAVTCLPQLPKQLLDYEDGDVRQMIVPGADRPTTVVLSSDTPASNPGTRHVEYRECPIRTARSAVVGVHQMESTARHRREK